VQISLRRVADGFSNANGIFHAGDDRLFVTEQEGYVVVLKRKADGTFRDGGVFLDIRDRVECCGEKGLLGIAFPPDYAESGRFYVTYAGAGHNWYLDERRVSRDDPDRADPAWRRSLIRIYKPRDFHWGGDMSFGQDGYLYIGMGDGGFDGGPNDLGDPDGRGQDLGTIFGKFLRIDPRDPDGRGRDSARYGIPEDNPYVDRPGAQPEIWLRGVRNPWRWSFDRVTGDLWVTDVGMHDWEEVNRLRGRNPGKGANLGWSLMEGPDCYRPSVGCERGVDLQMPIAAYRHENSAGGFRCAITGGYVYRGREFPAMRSWYFYGDYCSGEIFQLDSGGGNRQPVRVALDTGLAISSMGEDADGELYVADYTLNQVTSIYRIEGRARR
jgi:glucose/arabinose dehydrogenase